MCEEDFSGAVRSGQSCRDNFSFLHINSLKTAKYLFLKGTVSAKWTHPFNNHQCGWSKDNVCPLSTNTFILICYLAT